MSNTRKKIKIIGEVEYINRATGEIEKMQTVRMEERDFNFDKIWIMHILDSLEAVGNQKIKVMNELIKMKNNDNLIVATQDVICKKTGVSRPVVSQTLNILIESNFMKKIQNGVYMINPDTLFKGGKANRMNVLLKYQKQDEIKLEDNPDIHLLTNQEEQSELNLSRESNNDTET
jgi:hypothetical protein